MASIIRRVQGHEKELLTLVSRGQGSVWRFSCSCKRLRPVCHAFYVREIHPPGTPPRALLVATNSSILREDVWAKLRSYAKCVARFRPLLAGFLLIRTYMSSTRLYDDLLSHFRPIEGFHACCFLLSINNPPSPPPGVSQCPYVPFFYAQTAAHHLESMREARALGMGPGMTAYAPRGDVGAASPSQDHLLSEGVRDLLRRAEAEAAAVTELLEELRYEAEGLP